MKIALLDDDPRDNRRLLQLIDEYALARGCRLECAAFTSGRELLRRPDRFDLYILDYKMDEMDGVAVGMVLTEKYRGAVTVCYLTSMEAAAVDVINARIPATGFLTKPVDPARLYDTLDRYRKVSERGRLQLKTGRETKTVFAGEIVFAEAADKRTILRFAKDSAEVSHSFSEMERILADYPQFFRIQRSFIINMDHVASHDTKNVRMDNGSVLSLKNRDFARSYRDYVFQSVR